MLKKIALGLAVGAGLMIASVGGAQADPYWGVGFHTGGWGGTGVSIAVGNSHPYYHHRPYYVAPAYVAPYPVYGPRYAAPIVYSRPVYYGHPYRHWHPVYHRHW